MKRLDQFIDSHRDEIDILEPVDGHFNRFQEKLKPAKDIYIKWVLRIAGLFLFAAFISVKLINISSERDKNLSSELKEIAYFYNLRSEKLLSDIQNNEFMNRSQKQIILKDINEFDKEYSTILKDLKKFPDDDRLVNAFIDYHRSKTELLEVILNHISSTNLIII